MTAITIREPGGPDALVPTKRPVPVPGPEEILVAVAAAAQTTDDDGKHRPSRDFFYRLAQCLPMRNIADEDAWIVQISAFAGAGTKINLWELLKVRNLQ